MNRADALTGNSWRKQDSDWRASERNLDAARWSDRRDACNETCARAASFATIQVGQIIGNRRSKIYAWPGCGTYDKMAPENRVPVSKPRGR